MKRIKRSAQGSDEDVAVRQAAGGPWESVSER